MDIQKELQEIKRRLGILEKKVARNEAIKQDIAELLDSVEVESQEEENDEELN